MNTIERVKVIDDRVYVKVVFNAVDVLNLRFYVTTDKKEFIKNLMVAINCPTISMPLFGSEEKEESYINENIMNSVMAYLYCAGFENYLLNGVFHKTCGMRITELGKMSYALYMHIDVCSVELLELYTTYEEALLRMLEWRAGDSKQWSFTKETVRRTTYDAVMWDSLHSIDSIDELLKYKILHKDQEEYLVQKGLICITE